jgi:tripartite-type tricarboxylate transporter receptor subunit TctC
MIGSQISAVSGPIGEFTQHVAAGKWRLIAASGAKRSQFAPTTPTLVEQGIKGLEAQSSTPAELVARLKAGTDKWGPLVQSIGFTAEG